MPSILTPPISPEDLQAYENPWLNFANKLPDLQKGWGMVTASSEAPVAESQPTQPSTAPTPIQQMASMSGPNLNQSSSRSGLNFGTLNQLMKQYDEKSIQGMNNQKEVIDQLKQYRDKLPQGSGGIDLTGLMMLADAWGDGSSKVFTSGYKRPETADEREAKRASVTQAIGGAGKDLSAQELALLKTKLDAANESQRNALMAQKQTDFGGLKSQQDMREAYMKSKPAERAKALKEMNSSLERYRKLIEEKGEQYVGEDRKLLDSAYADFKTQWKEAKNLGAITGPDMSLIVEASGPVTGFKGLTGQVFTGGPKGVLNSLEQVQTGTMADIENNKGILKKVYPMVHDDMWQAYQPSAAAPAMSLDLKNMSREQKIQKLRGGR